MGDNRPPVYIEDGVLIIRASAIGHPCLWELIAAGQEFPMQPVPRVLQRAFDEGNLLEPVVVKMLERDHGVKFISHQSEGHLWLSDDVAIRYHSDGIGDWNTQYWVVEIKALGDALWQQAKRTSIGMVIEEYNWQMSSMMEAQQLPGLWVAYNKGLPPDDNGNRQPCVEAGQLLFEPVYQPPVSRTELELKASLIKEGVFGEDVVTSDRPCDSPNHWPCRYLHLRPQEEDMADRVSVLTVDGERAKEIDRLVREYLTFKGQHDEAKSRYEHARDELVKIAGDHTHIQTDKHYVPIVNGTSTRTDTKSMPKELLMAIAKYKRQSGYKYIRGIKRLEF